MPAEITGAWLIVMDISMAVVTLSVVGGLTTGTAPGMVAVIVVISAIIGMDVARP